MEEQVLLTRKQCSEILLSRGYIEADYPGVWIAPDGNKWAWFQAVCKERLKFDRKDKPLPDIVKKV